MDGCMSEQAKNYTGVDGEIGVLIG